MRTPVAIVGAGPAGLMLSHLLAQAGIASVVLEARTREYVEHRVRAGVLEHATARLLAETGVGERMRREGLVHRGIDIRFDGALHRIDFERLVGRTITVYGQQEVVKDLIAARLAAGGDIRFECEDVRVAGFEGNAPRVAFVRAGRAEEIECDFIAGCDGFHGVCRESIPAGRLERFERSYPFAWLGILASAAPAREELVYAHHDRGFALFSMRSPTVTRLYLQVPPDEDMATWPDARLWDELRTRLAHEGDWHPNEGPILEKGITPMRSFVAEPMQCGRLFLAGDAAHIVPPTGAKGLNLAMRDVRVLSAALERFHRARDESALAAYSRTCLKHVWRAEHFSWWMTAMLHRFPDNDPFQRRLQRSQLEYVVSSEAAAASLAENYVGHDG
ncbi:MAG: 4-hydroxybenzoate 3-monooxygenase [Betaproteobacteria bacterium]